MAGLNASEVFVRDMTEVFTLPDEVMRKRIMSRAGDQSVASILDKRLAPLKILYIPEETERVTSPTEYPSTVTVVPAPEPIAPITEPIAPVSTLVPISRESATAPDAKPALPYVAGGKLVGQRHYGDYCVNPLKKQEIVVVSPDAPETQPGLHPETPAELPVVAAGSCTIL